MAQQLHGALLPADEQRAFTADATTRSFTSAGYTLVNALHSVTLTAPANALLFVVAQCNFWAASGTGGITTFIDGVECQVVGSALNVGWLSPSGPINTVAARSFFGGQGSGGFGSPSWNHASSGTFPLVEGNNVGMIADPFSMKVAAGSHTIDVRCAGPSGANISNLKMWAWAKRFGS